MKGFGLRFNEIKNHRGAVAIIVALLLPILIGFAALALDIGYGWVVRNQLQNAADAAALAACNRLYDRAAPVVVPAPPPLWAAAIAESTIVITDNKADNKQLQVGTTEVGWWLVTQAYPGNLSNPTSNPIPGPAGSPPDTPPTSDYGPAVRVTINKTTGLNDGPVSSWFGKIFGRTSYDNGATAVAVAASPGSIRPGAVVPVAVAKEVVDKYYNIYNSESNPITIGTPYHYENDLAGQFTSFQQDASDVPTVRDLISTGNPTALSIGDRIWIQPGVKDTSYDSKTQPSIDNTYAGKDIFFPIIDAIVSDTTHSFEPIAGFIGFHIICAGKGCDGTEYDPNPSQSNEKIIVGYFTTAPIYGGPIGPHYGPLDRCRICR